MIETEIKLPVKDILEAIGKLGGISSYGQTVCIRDTIFGNGNKKKIRLRRYSEGNIITYRVEWKYKVGKQDKAKREKEELIYQGWSLNQALKAIRKEGKFKEENSYEKIRLVYFHPSVFLCLDIYPFGAFIEVEGEKEKIEMVANQLGYTEDDFILLTADEYYLIWAIKHGQKEQWDVRFGLEGK